MSNHDQADAAQSNTISNAIREDGDLPDSELDAISGGIIDGIGTISAIYGGILGGTIRGAMTGLGMTVPGSTQLSKPQSPPDHTY